MQILEQDAIVTQKANPAVQVSGRLKILRKVKAVQKRSFELSQKDALGSVSVSSAELELSSMEHDWTRYYDEANASYYLYNNQTGESRWEDAPAAAESADE